ncbi:MAG: TIGR00366 family protein, partial [Bacteroidales bacterium]|nr:TIGR00366 family protein [Bacteroidales bacterium]
MFGRIIDLSVKLIRKYLPDPFVFAILLTFIAFIAAIPVTDQS